MRIESIEIINFRQYQNVLFEFPHNPGVCDIHIILGENGEGKTNILNAITWCLYGEETHLGNKNTALPMINSQFVQQCREQGKQNGKTSVTILISTEDGQLRFRREAVFSLYGKEPIKTDETITVLTPDNKYYEDEDMVSMYLYRYVPQEINDYIFFDGEQLDDYFKEGKRDQIESGIKGLTQASVVKKAIDAFNRYLKKELNPVLDNADDTAVKEAQKKVKELSKRVDDAQETVNILEGQRKNSIETLEELDRIIKGHENLKDKALQMEKIEKEINDIQIQLDKKEAKMMEFTREYYTYFMLYPSMKRLYDYIQKQEREGNLPPKVDKKLVESILESKTCPICGSKDLNEEHLDFVKKVLNRLEFSSKTSNELNKASVALLDIFKKIKLYPSKVKDLRTDFLYYEKTKKEKEAEYKDLSDLIAAD